MNKVSLCHSIQDKIKCLEENYTQHFHFWNTSRLFLRVYSCCQKGTEKQGVNIEFLTRMQASLRMSIVDISKFTVCGEYILYMFCSCYSETCSGLAFVYKLRSLFSHLIHCFMNFNREIYKPSAAPTMYLNL